MLQHHLRRRWRSFVAPIAGTPAALRGRMRFKSILILFALAPSTAALAEGTRLYPDPFTTCADIEVEVGTRDLGFVEPSVSMSWSMRAAASAASVDLILRDPSAPIPEGLV